MKTLKKISVVLQAALTAYALQMKYDVLPVREHYKSGMHYFYAQVTHLLGEYSFNGLLIFTLALVFLFWAEKSGLLPPRREKALPVFFSFCLLTGRCYALAGSWSVCFGGVFGLIRFGMALAGFAFLFSRLIPLFLHFYGKAAHSRWRPAWAVKFFDGNCFRNMFLLLLIIWFPVLLLSYPGNLCYDFLGQIEQVFGTAGYSAHHPLLHTLAAGFLIKMFSALSGSRDIGLFAYVILQALALAAALAGTAARLSKRGVSYVLRTAVAGVYVFAPMYSNMVSTAVKDIPFMAVVIWYILLLEDLAAEGFADRKPLYWVRLILVQALAGLLRNNGIYMVVLTGLLFALLYWKRAGRKQALSLLLCLAVFPFAVCTAGNELMIHILPAQRGSAAEMLSVPFQQTARYLRLYRSELTEEEKSAVEGVLADVDAAAEKYNPDLADDVKALYYRTDAGAGDLAAYFKVWFLDFFKHPAVYAEAFLAHVYGWFDPGAYNAVRYEAETELFSQGKLFTDADKLLVFVYRFAGYIPFLAVLENVGVYTWMLFLLAGYARKNDCGGRGFLLIPLFVSLLICMASPCFYLHPRYAYPILFTLPFLYGIMNGGVTDEKCACETRVLQK